MQENTNLIKYHNTGCNNETMKQWKIEQSIKKRLLLASLLISSKVILTRG